MSYSRSAPKWSEASPQEHLDLALKCVQDISIQNQGQDGRPFMWRHQKAINWSVWADVARQELLEIQQPDREDVCGILDRALVRVGDRHSLIVSPHYYRYSYKPTYGQGAQGVFNALAMPWRDVKALRLPQQQAVSMLNRPQSLPHVAAGDGYLYLQVPAFSLDSGMADAYQDKLRSAQLAQAKEPLHGVIVDLRRNGGGSCVPMLYGLSPLLGDGDVFGFAGPSGGYLTSPNNMAHFANLPRLEKKSDFPLVAAPVAVLSGPGCASSGEITLMSLHGRPLTRVFGQASAGSSSGNSDFKLFEDTIVNVTSAIMVDRNGFQSDGGPIAPDVVTDKPLRDAVRWLRSFPAQTYG